MRRLLSVLLVASPLAAQVAQEANRTTQTAEGRRSLAAILDAPGRDALQRPKELVAAIGIKPGMTVADLGTGVGYLLPHLSAAVGPRGKVIAQEILPDYLEKAKAKAAREGLGNITFVQGTETDPRLEPGSIDLVLALDVYHHFDYPEKMLAAIHASMKDGGRFAIVEYYKRRGAMPNRDPDFALSHVRLDEAGAIREIESNGFRLVESRAFIPQSQYLAVFEKK